MVINKVKSNRIVLYNVVELGNIPSSCGGIIYKKAEDGCLSSSDNEFTIAE